MSTMEPGVINAPQLPFGGGPGPVDCRQTVSLLQRLTGLRPALGPAPDCPGREDNHIAKPTRPPLRQRTAASPGEPFCWLEPCWSGCLRPAVNHPSPGNCPPALRPRSSRSRHRRRLPNRQSGSCLRPRQRPPPRQLPLSQRQRLPRKPRSQQKPPAPAGPPGVTPDIRSAERVRRPVRPDIRRSVPYLRAAGGRDHHLLGRLRMRTSAGRRPPGFWRRQRAAVSQIDAESHHSSAVRQDGAVECWGGSPLEDIIGSDAPPEAKAEMEADVGAAGRPVQVAERRVPVHHAGSRIDSSAEC